MRLRLVTTIVRSRAASPADSWSASGRAISAPAITTSVDSGRSSCPNQNQAKASHHGGGQPRLRRVRMTDRLVSSSSESVLKASSRPNGIRPNGPRTSSAAKNTATARTVNTSLRRTPG